MLGRYVSSLEELNGVCDEILRDMESIEESQELIDELQPRSVGDLVAKILIAAYVYSGELEEFGEEDIEELAREIDANIEQSGGRLPRCLELAEVVTAVKGKE